MAQGTERKIQSSFKKEEKKKEEMEPILQSWQGERRRTRPLSANVEWAGKNDDNRIFVQSAFKQSLRHIFSPRKMIKLCRKARTVKNCERGSFDVRNFGDRKRGVLALSRGKWHQLSTVKYFSGSFCKQT